MSEASSAVRCPDCNCGHCPGQIIQQTDRRLVRLHTCRYCGRRFRNVTKIVGPSLLSRAVALFRPSAADPDLPSREEVRSNRGGRRPGAGRPTGERSAAIQVAFMLKRFLSAVPAMSALVEKMVADSPEYQQWLQDQEP